MLPVVWKGMCFVMEHYNRLQEPHTNSPLCDHVCLMSDPIRLQGCSGDERVMGRAMSDVLSKHDKQVVMEGQEPAEFWVALGGKAPYASDKR